MSTNEINTILRKLDTLEEKIDSLDEVHIINGGGRDVVYHRSEFFQMLYDWRKEKFNSVSDFSKKLDNIFDVFIKLASLVAIIYAAINLGGN